MLSPANAIGPGANSAAAVCPPASSEPRASSDIDEAEAVDVRTAKRLAQEV